MALPGSNAVVTIAHLTQTRGPHGDKTDGEPDQSFPGVEAVVERPARGNLFRVTVAGNFGQITKAPSEWQITDNQGRTFGCVKATYRPPIERLAESEHTLIFGELHGEIDQGQVRV